jgi:flagellar protein FlaG
MISSIPQSTATITILVGQEIRVREGHKSMGGEVSHVNEKKNVARQEDKMLQESRNLEQDQVALTRLQETLQHVEARIEFSVDKELNQVIIRVLDKETGDLIRQIPSEEVLALDRFFVDQSGLFVEEEI